MALKLKIFNFFFILLIFSGTIPVALAGGGDNGGGGDAVQLDYDSINEFKEEELSVTKNPLNFIDLASLDEPIEYRVAIWLNNVGKIEKESGVYELDFWYTVSSDDVNFLEVGIPPVTFTNSKVTHLESDYMEEHYYEVRVRGTFFNVLDWSLFPFEKIELNVEIEPNSPYFIENTVLIVDEELIGIDDKVNVVGWKLLEPVFEIDTHEYENYGSFSRFVAAIPIERSTTGAILKTIFPVLMITGVSMLIFLIPKNFSSRIYLTAPLLLAVVFLHRGSLGELPTLDYMTVFDKFMIIVYALFANSILTLAIQMKFDIGDKDDVKVRKVNMVMLYMIPVIIGILAVALFPL